ncbi:hypothetical protein [Parasphingorhabdus sp.]|jgi:hypothetical protein|uniref:hypothetical protein n=1 Tax=Parasphingorhabdus sp. TaxID=2709688 RepID=UPI003D2D54F2
MQKILIALLGLLCSQTLAFSAFSQTTATSDPLQYADLADLSINAPIIVHATVKEAIKVDPERAVDAPTSTQRFYVIATTNALIRGQGGILETIRYIVDLPLDQRGRAPKIKKRQFIIFAQRTGDSNDVQLIAKDAQIAWTADRESRVRALVREIVAADAPPSISRIAGAFHVPGTIIGEGETQIFMETNNGNPVSITILSRDGQRKFWAVSLGEIVDEAARAPERNSLLWYRLACFLPKRLPSEALEGVSLRNAREAQADYQMVLADLGSCPRSRR